MEMNSDLPLVRKNASKEFTLDEGVLLFTLRGSKIDRLYPWIMYRGYMGYLLEYLIHRCNYMQP
jgi:hypothetical protein